MHIAERIAAGDRFQDLTRPTKSLANESSLSHLARATAACSSRSTGRRHVSVAKPTRSPALERTAGHPRQARRSGDGGGVMGAVRGPGQWTLGSLPESPDAARRAGALLAELSTLRSRASSPTCHAVSMPNGSTSTTLRPSDASPATAAGSESTPSCTPMSPRSRRLRPQIRCRRTPIRRRSTSSSMTTAPSRSWTGSGPRSLRRSGISRRPSGCSARSPGPAAAEALQQGYGRMLGQIQLNRWIVYHAAMHLVYEAEQRMSDHGADAYAATVAELRKAAALGNP